MAAASQRHNCDGQQWRQQRKGWQDGRKIVINNDYGNGQLWVKWLKAAATPPLPQPNNNRQLKKNQLMLTFF
jgi:hypothetical protein